MDLAAPVALSALVDGLWQGLALTALVALLLRLAPRANAATRYAVWFATLVTVAVAPVVIFCARVPWRPPPAPAPAAVAAVPLATSLFPMRVAAGVAPLAVLILWAMLSVALLCRLAAAYRRLGQLKRASRLPAEPCRGWLIGWLANHGAPRRVVLRESGQVPLPQLAGLVRPAILFPQGLAAQLSEPEARQVWLHEVAHLRRWDDWTQLAQKLIEVAFFFHPAVHWIGRRLALEREIACDDAVAVATGSPRGYAQCLARLAELAAATRSRAPALAAATNRRQIFRRVEMLLNPKRNPGTGMAKPLLFAILAMLISLGAATSRLTPLLAFTVDEWQEAAPVPPQPPAPAAAPAPPQTPAPKAAPAPPAPVKQEEEVRRAIEKAVEAQRRLEHALLEERRLEDIRHRLANRKLEQELASWEELLKLSEKEQGVGMLRKLEESMLQIRELEVRMKQLEKTLQRLEKKQWREPPPPPPPAGAAPSTAPPAIR